MSITLHASSFAAFIGKHPYTKQHEVFEKTWQRASPATYSAALQRHRRVTDQERLEALRSKIPEVDVTLHAAEMNICTSARVVTDSRDTLTKELGGETVLTLEEKKLVSDEIRKQLFTRYGTAQERSVLDILVDEMGMELSPEDTDAAYTKLFVTANGTPWKLVGKIDACTSDKTTVIEVKNRVRRLFMHATEYERIQVECYLRLVETAERALLVESLSADGDGRTLNIIPLEKDDALWGEWHRIAGMYVEYLHRMIRDPSLQDSYFRSKRPSAFLRKVLDE